MGVVKLGDVARESRLKWTKSKQDVPIVGLEHLIPDEIRFDAYDINTDNTFSKRFVKGQVLFGRRRAYQRKAAIAEFDGICSGDITVIQAIERKMVPELLPFIIQTPVFFDYANRGSAGSLSPRVKWEHLADYEFELPPLEEQKILADKLWAAYRLKEAYKKLLVATDEMVKSQFIEMFGNTPMSYEMQDCFSLIRNGANIKQGQFEGGIPITRIETISDEIVDRQKMGYAGIADNKYELYYLQDGDILISHINSLKHIGKCALYNKKENESIIHGMNLLCLRPNIVTINPVFAIHMLRSNIIRKGITDITKPAVNQASFSAKDFGKLRTIIPPMDKQMLFVSIAEQADKSKSVIQKALVYLNDIQSDELGKIA